MTQTISAGSRSLLVRRAGRVALWQSPDWQRLWLSTQQVGRSWRSLAIVPAGPGAPDALTLHIAFALSQIGAAHLGATIQVADARGVELHQVMPFRREVEQCTRGDDRVLIALAPVAASVVSSSLAQSADSSLLCVLQGRMLRKDIKASIAAIGVERFLGAAMFRWEH